MKLKTKLILLAGGLSVCGLIAITMYCKGIRVGVAKEEAKDVKEEVAVLEKEKEDVKVDLKDTSDDGARRLHDKILDLSRRLAKEATRRHR